MKKLIMVARTQFVGDLFARACLLTVCLCLGSHALAEPPRDQHGVKTAVPIQFVGVRAELVTGSPIHVVVPGQENRVAFVFTNQTSKAARLVLHVEVESFDGDVKRDQAQLELPANGSLRWPWPKALFGRLGIKWIQYWLEHDGRVSEKQFPSFAYLVPAREKRAANAGFKFGIAYGAGRDNWSEEAALAAATIGINVARLDVPCPWVREDRWDWERIDQCLSVHEAQGIEPQLLILGIHHWMREDPQRSMVKMNLWRQYIRTLAERYRHRVKYWEIWNEPDIFFFQGTTDEYRQLLRAAYEEIKQVDPKLQVMNGGFVSLVHGGRKPGLIETVIRGDQDYFDLLAYHTHGEFRGIFWPELDERLLPYCQAVLRESKPLYFTETGMDCRFGQHFQARTLPKKVVFAWARGAVAYTWFNLHDVGETYGLYTLAINRDPQNPRKSKPYPTTWPKAAYPAYNTLTGLLHDQRFATQYPLERGHFAFLFTNAQRQVVVAWNELPEIAAPQLIVSTDAQQAEQVDLMGNASPVPLTEGRLLLDLKEEPAYFVLQSARQLARVEGALMHADRQFQAIPGRRLTVTAEAWNPFDRPLEVRAQWLAAAALGGKRAAQILRLPPRERQSLELNLQVPPSLSGAFGTVHTCRLDYHCVGLSWTGRIEVPVVVGAVLLPQKEFTAHPTFRLNQPTQVVRRHDYDPSTVSLQWSGPKDLSAKVWLAKAEAGLRLRVEVQDDEFRPPKVADLRDGDHVEVLMSRPEENGFWGIVLGEMEGAGCAWLITSSSEPKSTMPEILVAATLANGTRNYTTLLPDALWNPTGKSWTQGIRLDIRVHDVDDRGPEGWLQVAPTDAGENARLFPLLLAQ